jgi:tryptophanyl-tRNA synthetase
MRRRVVLTGIKPTGTVHIGNLLGAIRPALTLADAPDTLALYFIADYHALTSVHDRERLSQITYEVAATWLALGLDPTRVVLYRQSDVPEIFELSWILACMTAKGWMNKAHAYKAKVDQNRESGDADLDAGVSIGLYTYPVLMAADILAFGSDIVPVGKDQVQHVEIARDMAQRVNHLYGDVLVLPKPLVKDDAAVIQGLDGRKMSKSYDNVIPIFAPQKQLKKLINRIVTDSTPPEVPKDPSTSSVFQIFRAVASKAATETLAERYAAGIGWGEAKAALFEVLDESLREPRSRYEALMADKSKLDLVLNEGAERARAIARPRLDRVRAAIGITGRAK